MARVAFVMEQTLGHVTHARNLRAALDATPDIAGRWLPIPFEVGGAARLIPLYGNNWSIRASWRARRELKRALARGPLDALFFHTQVTSLFSVDLMRQIPTIISLDATPFNFDAVGASYGHRAARSQATSTALRHSLAFARTFSKDWLIWLAWER